MWRCLWRQICIPEHRVFDDCSDPGFKTRQEADVASVQCQVKVEVGHLNKGYLHSIMMASVQPFACPDPHKLEARLLPALS